MPRIDTTGGGYYTGLGDMVSLAWLAEGSRKTADPISFYATGDNLTVLRLLAQDVYQEPAGSEVRVSDAYHKEWDDGGAKLRLDYVREVLGIQTPLARPQTRIGQEPLAWAAQVKERFSNDLVLLFPQASTNVRAWPPAYWVDLAWMLKQRNVAAVTMLANEDERFKATPDFYWSVDLEKLTALIRLASLVVANDSGPAHLAGTMRVPTIVTAGPTRRSCVYGHIPEVMVLTSDEAPRCAGCHFMAPYRAACDLGCQALYSLQPHVVLGHVISELARISVDPPRDRRALYGGTKL